MEEKGIKHMTKLQKGKKEKVVQQEQAPSILDEKKQELLDQVNEMMDNMGGNFGPVIQQELQRRLESCVRKIDEEIQALIKESFKKWEVKNSQIRDLINSNISMSEFQTIKQESNNSSDLLSKPEFIKDVEFGPLRSK